MSCSTCVSRSGAAGDCVPGVEQALGHVAAHVTETDEADGGCRHSGIISGPGP